MAEKKISLLLSQASLKKDKSLPLVYFVYVCGRKDFDAIMKKHGLVIKNHEDIESAFASGKFTQSVMNEISSVRIDKSVVEAKLKSKEIVLSK